MNCFLIIHKSVYDFMLRVIKSVKIVSGIILMIGYIMAGFTEKRQGLHDIIAGCLVLRKDTNRPAM